MSTGGQGTKWRTNIGKNFDGLSRVHERYRETDRQATAYNERARTVLCCIVLLYATVVHGEQHTQTHTLTHTHWHVSCSYVLLLLKVFVGFIALLLSCGRSAFARISIFVFLYIFHVSLCIFWFFVSATGNWKYLSNNVIILWGTLSCVGIWELCWPSDDLEGQRTCASVRTKVRNIEFIICCVSKSSSLPVLLGATLTSEDANSLTYTSLQSSWRIQLVHLEAAAFLLTHRKSHAPDLIC